MKKKRWIICWSIIAMVCVCLIGLRIYQVNTNKKYDCKTWYHKAGETVNVGSNYFLGSNEDPDGYFFKIKGATVRKYQSYVESLGGEINYANYESMGTAPPRYVYDVEVEITNTDNTDGFLYLQNYALYDDSLILNFDYTIWNLVEPEFEGQGAIRLREDSTATIHMYFTEDPYYDMMDSEQVDKRILNNSFSLGISYYPERHMMEIGDPVIEE